MPTIDAIIVNWNSGEAVHRCLASLDAAVATATRFAFDRIVIVDNASAAAYRPGRYDRLPAVTLISNDTNRGFAAACNQGAAGSQADYLLFINPDATLVPPAPGGGASGGVLDRAVAVFEDPAGRDVAVVGPQLVDARGVPQATCGRFLTVRGVLNQLTGLSLAAPRRLRGFRMTDWDHRDSRDVDYVSAACCLVRRGVFAALGGFDAAFRVYLEDADFALRARRAGWRSVYLADAAVCHEGGWATGRDRALRLAHAWRSLLVYAVRHFDPARAAVIVAATLTLAPLARLGQAASHASWQEAREALMAYARLCGWLARHLLPLPRAADHDGGRARREPVGETAPIRDNVRTRG